LRALAALPPKLLYSSSGYLELRDLNKHKQSGREGLHVLSMESLELAETSMAMLSLSHSSSKEYLKIKVAGFIILLAPSLLVPTCVHGEGQTFFLYKMGRRSCKTW